MYFNWLKYGFFKSQNTTGFTTRWIYYIDFIDNLQTALIEESSIFALEKHLEDFLVKNWHHTELGKLYDIYEEDGEIVGQQYPSDTGPIDILAICKDKKAILVVELKKGRVSDVVIG